MLSFFFEFLIFSRLRWRHFNNFQIKIKYLIIVPHKDEWILVIRLLKKLNFKNTDSHGNKFSEIILYKPPFDFFGLTSYSYAYCSFAVRQRSLSSGKGNPVMLWNIHWSTKWRGVAWHGMMPFHDHPSMTTEGGLRLCLNNNNINH